MSHSDPAYLHNCNKAKREGYPFISMSFGYWSVFVAHLADPKRGTFPADTSLRARAEAAMPNDDDDNDADDFVGSSLDDAESSELFYTTAQPALPADFDNQRAADAQVDKNGDDIAVDQSNRATQKTPLGPKPNEDYCRVYDCETFLEAFIVWLIALLHTKRGVIDKTDLSAVICRLFRWEDPYARPNDE